MAAIMDVDMLLRRTNDYGDSTGYCEELDHIQNDALAQLGTLRARAYTLKRRFSLTQADKGREAAVDAARDLPHHGFTTDGAIGMP